MSFKLHATVVALVIGWSAGQVVLAQSSGQNPAIRREAARPISSIEGKDSFAAYCAACHGKEAKGNGPVAAALKTAPADLTRIAARNGGTFDIIRVERVILGTDKVLPSHGSSDMPIWGPVFHALYPDTGAEAIRVRNLVNYLKSIQAK